MVQQYQDAMAICRSVGTLDLFVTCTCNPTWPKIKYMIEKIPRQRVEDRPNIVARVFKLKLKELLNNLIKKHFGTVVAGT